MCFFAWELLEQEKESEDKEGTGKKRKGRGGRLKTRWEDEKGGREMMKKINW